MKSEYVWVTKDMASEWLKHNKCNRRLRPSRVKNYAFLMDAKMWLPNSSGIGFDVNGDLINGQHRLSAVVAKQTDDPVHLLICRGLSEDAFLTEDDGAKRTLRDILVRNNNGHSSTAPTLKAMLSYSRPVQMVGGVGNKQGEIYFLQFKESVIFASSLSPNGESPTTSPVLGVIARAHHCGEDREMLENFVAVMRANRPIIGDPVEDSALILAKYCMMQVPGRVGANRAKDITYKTERALQAYLKGERLIKIFGTKTNPWPVFVK